MNSIIHILQKICPCKYITNELQIWLPACSKTQSKLKVQRIERLKLNGHVLVCLWSNSLVGHTSTFSTQALEVTQPNFWFSADIFKKQRRILNWMSENPLFPVFDSCSRILNEGFPYIVLLWLNETMDIWVKEIETQIGVAILVIIIGHFKCCTRQTAVQAVQEIVHQPLSNRKMWTTSGL